MTGPPHTHMNDMPPQDILMAHDWDPELLQHDLCEELAIQLPWHATASAEEACAGTGPASATATVAAEGEQAGRDGKRQVLLMRGLRTSASGITGRCCS